MVGGISATPTEEDEGMSLMVPLAVRGAEERAAHRPPRLAGRCKV